MNTESECSIDRKITAIVKENPWMELTTLEDKVIRISQENASYHSKRMKMRQLADRFNSAVTPQTACRMGCSACCHMPTMLYRHEAELLAKASGRKMATLRWRPAHKALQDTAKFLGVPCPFLERDLCTVYDVRPIICKLHHSLNETPAACDTSLPIEQRVVASFDVDIIEMPYHLLVLKETPVEPWGCIQEFFPE